MAQPIMECLFSYILSGKCAFRGTVSPGHVEVVPCADGGSRFVKGGVETIGRCKVGAEPRHVGKASVGEASLR